VKVCVIMVRLSFFPPSPPLPPSRPPSYLGLDKRIHIPKLLLDLLDRLRDERRGVPLVATNALDQVLQGLLKHDWSVAWMCGGGRGEEGLSRQTTN